MNKFKKIFYFIILLLLLVPTYVFAYSNKVILGGNSIGIKVNTKYVMIVGFYKVNGSFIAEESGFKIGDNIIKINNNDIRTINEMIEYISNDEDKIINFTVLRNNKEKELSLNLIKDKNDIYKTGLYVKDMINGIGSITYIDPETKIYGALGHDISSKYTNKIVDIDNGNIFKSEIIGIEKSRNGKAGSKEAKLYTDKVYGDIKSNTITGIYGTYNEETNLNNLIEIAKNDEIKLGKAMIRTVLSNHEIKNYEIEIININRENSTKNLLFKVTDKELLDKTGGIVAGMSGSPIIQNNKLIGAVTHVVVNEPNKGFGIFITTMLEEGDKSR